ncbi:conserved hypothetical protein [Histoplasma capsulatum H143]|uniref:Uncharacterized protein n=1 Tax=Ajellomyces capsulatus (strain H143) TaxID=544712 RepID=C6HM20_AJECH|nr:conserved hypothetical protein [Histoplasma capsulatum H143]
MQPMQGHPTRKGVTEDGQENTGATRPHSPSNEPKSRRYEIRTLLDIGRRLGAKSDSSSYSCNTIDVASLRHRKEHSENRVLVEKPVNRHRISSSFSLSNEDGLLLSQANSVQYPRRQPLNAPQGNLAQSDAGFARFLKEHASPKHHRVTAGGRIVPMNLASSPAPEFKLPAKSSEKFEMRKTNNNYLQNRTLKRCTDFNHEMEGIQQPVLRRESDSNTPAGLNLVPRVLSGSDCWQMNHPQHTVPNVSTRATSGQQSQRRENGPFNSHHMRDETVGQLTPESTSAASGYSVPNGGIDQTGWTPNNIQQYNAPSSTGQSFPMAYTSPHGAILGMYPADQSSIMMSAPIQLFPISTIPINQSMIQHAQASNLVVSSAGLSGEPLTHKALEKASQEYDTLTDQLSNLDRYLAIHSWDIDPVAKKILIDQRVELVMKLDTARSTKEQIEAAIQYLVSQPTDEQPSRIHLDVGGNMFRSASEEIMECSPAEIARVYHDIETAASRGEPLGPLIEELAIVARKLNISGIAKRQDIVMRRGKESPCIDPGENQLTIVPFNRGTTIASSSDKSNHTRSVTTGSQVTSQDSMNQNSTIRTPEKHWDTSLHRTTGQDNNGSKHKDDDNNIYSGRNRTRTENAGASEEKRLTYDGGSLDNLCKDSKIMSPTPAGKTAVLEQHLSVSSNAAAGDKETRQTAPRSNEFPFSPWNQVAHHGGLQPKATTSTASYNVNAYGFVPRFDGANDPDNRNPKAASDALNSAVTRGASKTTGDKWYRKTPRKDPDPLDLEYGRGREGGQKLDLPLHY